MLRFVRTFAFFVVLVVAPAGAIAASGPASVPGSWRRLPPSPITPDFGSARSVWTGKEMLVFGHDTLTAKDARGTPYAMNTVNVAAAYDPAKGTWRRLDPPRKADAVGSPNVVWTGKQLLDMEAFSTLVYDPATNHWRRIPHGHGGLAIWTGREMLAWGGGCCGDANSDGVAYNPSTYGWRALARSPLAGSQHPVGAWTGRELVLFVGNLDPNGKPWPARLARAAAYSPATNTWRRIASPPQSDGTAVWDGSEILVVGAGARGQSAYAYNPVTNRWRRLRPLDSGRSGAQAVWTGKRLLVYGGTGPSGSPVFPRHGLAYDPKADRWSPLPTAPLPARLEPTAAWTGRAMIVWGGVSTDTWGKYHAAGATFTPATS